MSVSFYDLVDLRKGDFVIVDGKEYTVERVQTFAKEATLLDVMIHTEDGNGFLASQSKINAAYKQGA